MSLTLILGGIISAVAGAIAGASVREYSLFTDWRASHPYIEPELYERARKSRNYNLTNRISYHIGSFGRDFHKIIE